MIPTFAPSKPGPSAPSSVRTSDNAPIVGMTDLPGSNTSAPGYDPSRPIVKIEDLAPLNSKPTSSGSTGGTIITKKSSDYIIGVPPAIINSGEEGGQYHERALYASLPVMDIMPCRPSFGSSKGDNGLQIFHLRNAADEFKKVVEACGFKKASSLKTPIKIAFVGSNQVGESWTNQFGDSMFERGANMASSLGELRQIAGASSSGVAGLANNALMSTSLSKIAGVPEQLNEIERLEKQLKSEVGPMGTDIMKLAEGSRIDFPMVWQGSSYSPSYNFTIRLYNPDTANKQSYEDNILYPLAILLALITPTSDSVYTYDFPFMCSIRCPGLFELPAAGITSIQVVKGGEVNRVLYNQQPGAVDVQMDVQSLYSTMVASTDGKVEGETDRERPTLKKYFDAMRGSADYLSTTNLSDTSISSETNSGVPTETATGVDTNTTPGDRVSADVTEAGTQLAGASDASENPELTPTLAEMDAADMAVLTGTADAADPGYVAEEAAAFRSDWVTAEDPNYPAYQEWVADGKVNDPENYIIAYASTQGGGDANAFFRKDPIFTEWSTAGNERLTTSTSIYNDFLDSKTAQFDYGWVYEDDEFYPAYQQWSADGKVGDPATYIENYASEMGNILMPNAANPKDEFIRTSNDYRVLTGEPVLGRNAYYDDYGILTGIDESINSIRLSGSPSPSELDDLITSISITGQSSNNINTASNLLVTQSGTGTISGLNSAIDSLISRVNSFDTILNTNHTTVRDVVSRESAGAALLTYIMAAYLASAVASSNYPPRLNVETAATELSTQLNDSADIEQLGANYATRLTNLNNRETTLRAALQAIHDRF